jgi:hypothetical protein
MMRTGRNTVQAVGRPDYEKLAKAAGLSTATAVATTMQRRKIMVVS